MRDFFFFLKKNGFWGFPPF
uniref:Uncharacterized protein n=1 Tax=Rhizophora mucronata TaxID=61149 RepID=A0A2P2Q1Y5_RHIMU